MLSSFWLRSCFRSSFQSRCDILARNEAVSLFVAWRSADQSVGVCCRRFGSSPRLSRFRSHFRSRFRVCVGVCGFPVGVGACVST